MSKNIPVAQTFTFTQISTFDLQKLKFNLFFFKKKKRMWGWLKFYFINFVSIMESMMNETVWTHKNINGSRNTRSQTWYAEVEVPKRKLEGNGDGSKLCFRVVWSQDMKRGESSIIKRKRAVSTVGKFMAAVCLLIKHALLLSILT